MFSLKYTIGAVSVALCSLSFAATVQIDYGNTTVPMTTLGGVNLTAGGNAAGDGAIIQIGYFTGATSTFTGTWVPITGLGSVNSALLTSVGDGGESTDTGIFQAVAIFNTDNPQASGSLPANNTQLAFRIYNDTTLAGSTHYNTVTNANWLFKTPATPAPTPITMSMDAAGLVWQDAANPFKTSIVIPEPSTALLGAVGALGLLRRRRD
jgi:hypothetical protein